MNASSAGSQQPPAEAPKTNAAPAAVNSAPSDEGKPKKENKKEKKKDGANKKGNYIVFFGQICEILKQCQRHVLCPALRNSVTSESFAHCHVVCTNFKHYHILL